MLNDNNFIKWLALKTFKFKEMKLAMLQKLQTFVFFNEIYFLLARIYFKCNLKNPE